MEIINVNNLTYTTSMGKSIIDNISFSANKGDKIAILGDNGSGKTTLLELMVGIIKPTNGSVLIDGVISSKAKFNYGIVWDQAEIFPWLKVCEVIKYFAAIRGANAEYHSLCNILGIQKIQNQFMKTLSKGEKKKVALAIALMHNPSIVFLDEFSSGVDEKTLEMVWNNYLQFNKKTVIFSTHNWEEAEKYASKLMFLKEGKLLLSPSTKEEIKKVYPFSFKIVIEDGICMDQSGQYPAYKNNGQVNILLNSLDEKYITNIARYTSKYSVVNVDLLDIYNYIKDIKA